jgi:hypothetical protein
MLHAAMVERGSTFSGPENQASIIHVTFDVQLNFDIILGRWSDPQTISKNRTDDETIGCLPRPWYGLLPNSSSDERQAKRSELRIDFTLRHLFFRICLSSHLVVSSILYVSRPLPHLRRY